MDTTMAGEGDFVLHQGVVGRILPAPVRKGRATLAWVGVLTNEVRALPLAGGTHVISLEVARHLVGELAQIIREGVSGGWQFGIASRNDWARVVAWLRDPGGPGLYLPVTLDLTEALEMVARESQLPGALEVLEIAVFGQPLRRKRRA